MNTNITFQLHTISVPMAAREALLLPPPRGHRGWWAVTPEQARDIAVGDVISFEGNGQRWMRGVVIEVDAKLVDCGTPDGRPSDLARAMELSGISAINGRVFRWEPIKRRD